MGEGGCAGSWRCVAGEKATLPGSYARALALSKRGAGGVAVVAASEIVHLVKRFGRGEVTAYIDGTRGTRQ
eukprot:1275406-Rhodomonas_salina.1